MTKKQKGKHIHLVGIGGSGISAIAQVLLGRGFRVSGSDQRLTPRTADLYAEGATIYKGHRASNITGAHMVVVSAAIPDDNEEVVAARRQGIPILTRSDLLGSLMNKNVGIAVAGTHGKTTTAGMIAQILLEAETDPTVIIGGMLAALGGNGRAGKGKHFVLEADEYERMFLGLRPSIGVVTNVDYDHPDSYPTAAAYQQAFADFVKLLPAGGCLVACAEHATAVELLKLKSDITRFAYGIGYPITPTPGLELLLAQDVEPNGHGGCDFTVEYNLEEIGTISLQVPGEHNVSNALAATAVALHEKIPFETIARALANFEGVGRRFDVRGEVGGITVVDDYAHHPVEIATTLAAARMRYPDKRLLAVWQPHTFSRIKLLREEFNRCFEDADAVLVLDVYASRETDTLGLTGAGIAEGVAHGRVRHVGTLDEATSFLLDHLKAGDVMVTLNAGDAHTIGEGVLNGLRERGHYSIEEEVTLDMNEDEKKNTPKDEKEKPIKLDATAAQVRRLVDRLKNKPESGQDAGAQKPS